MKRLVLTHLGGMPFEQEDLKYLQDATKEEIMAVIGAFKNPAGWMVVSGCVASDAGSGDVAVSAGWVIFGGELGYYAGSTIADTAGNFPTPEFDTDVLVDAAGTEVFEDGTTHDTYLNTSIILIGTGSALNQAQYIAAINGFPRIQNYFHKAVMEDWVKPILDPAAVTPTGYSSEVLQYRKTYGNRVELSGSFSVYPGLGLGIVLFTLPVEYRPNQRRYLSMNAKGLAAPDLTGFYTDLWINTDGTVVCNSEPTNTIHYLLHGLSYELEVSL